jgi:hypothetical protein
MPALQTVGGTAEHPAVVLVVELWLEKNVLSNGVGI